MKNLFKGFIGALVATMALAACGGNAHAAQLADTYVTGDNVVFTLATVQSIDKGLDTLYLQMLGENPQYTMDNSNVVYNAIKLHPDFSKSFVAIPGQPNRYLNVRWYKFTCDNNWSRARLPAGVGSGQVESFNDACALRNAVKALAN